MESGECEGRGGDRRCLQNSRGQKNLIRCDEAWKRGEKTVKKGKSEPTDAEVK
jgi:hypothetical protein